MREYFEARILEEIDSDSTVNVSGGHTWPGSAILETMEQSTFHTQIDERVQEKVVDAKRQTREFLTATGCVERFQLLCEKKEQQRVLPFIGAGMSLPSGFKLWSDLLLDLTADSPALRERVEACLAGYQYEDAAQDICDTLGEAALNHDIEAFLGRGGYELNGAVKLLPFCFQSGCITTNLDNVLERVYLETASSFGDPVSGAALKQQRGFVNPDENKLFKLHGTAASHEGRVLTRQEYDQTYANDVTLSRILDLIIGNRHLLFIGCSLGVDRTVQELTRLFAEAAGNYPQHFAFLPVYDNTDRETRRKELAQANITPIWYPMDEGSDHDNRLENLLVCLAEGGLDD